MGSNASIFGWGIPAVRPGRRWNSSVTTPKLCRLQDRRPVPQADRKCDRAAQAAEAAVLATGPIGESTVPVGLSHVRACVAVVCQRNSAIRASLLGYVSVHSLRSEEHT